MAAPEDTPQGSIAPLLEESLDDLYEHAPAGYLSALGDGTIVKVNQTFLDWTGYARDELVGRRRFQDLLTPGGQIYHETHFAPLLRMQESVREIALQIRCADGSRLPVLINSTLRRAAGTDRTVVRTTVFNATDRNAYEQELLLARRRERSARERTERLQSLSAALAVALTDEEVGAASLDTVTAFVEATGGTIDVLDADGDRMQRLSTRGTPPADAALELELTGPGGPAGTMRLALPAAREISESEHELLLACARQCGQALERARLHAETARTARQYALLAELGRGLEETRAFAGRAERLVAMIVPALADAARVEVAAEDGLHTIAEARGPAGGESGPPTTFELMLRARGRILGRLLLSTSRPVGRGERRFLEEVASRAALGLENARLYEHEHEVAAALQRSMLTSDFPDDPRFQVAAHYEPSVETMEVGGDWYDAFVFGEDRVAIVVGDVVGRGIAAATAMGQLRSAVRALAGTVDGPAELLVRLDSFVETLEIARSATLVVAELDLASGRVRYACAGHPPPVLAAPGEAPVLLWEGRSPPLGATAASLDRVEADLDLAPGSRVLFYTDGLVERRDQPIDEGMARLVSSVGARPDAPLAALVETLPPSLVDADAAADDVCLLAFGFGVPDVFERTVGADVGQLAPLRADLRAWLAAQTLSDDDRGAIVLATSEAAANAVEHGCAFAEDCSVAVRVRIEEGRVIVEVSDDGAWRAERNVPDDRGRGMTIIGHLMEDVSVERDGGTRVRMVRRVGGGPA